MEHLSFSRLSLLDTCGLRFFFEYVEKRPPQDPVVTYHASFGRLIHRMYEDHANSGGEATADDLKADYDRSFPPLVPEFPDRDTAVAFYRSGLQALHRFSRFRVTDVVASEREFNLEIAPGLPPVKGFIDRLIRHEGAYIVADLKTGKPFSGRDPRKRRQLALYSLACDSLYGQSADSGYFDFIVYGSREWVDIGERERSDAVDWVKGKWAQIKREEFFPRYAAGYCPRYCPFRSVCPEYISRTEAAAAKGVN